MAGMKNRAIQPFCRRNNLCVYTCVLFLQVDSPAQLANELVNVTDNTEEIRREDISLTVGLLDTVAQSTEDLQQEDVSGVLLPTWTWFSGFF